MEHSDRVMVYSAGYRAPIYAWNSSIDVFAARSDVSGVSTVTTAGTLSFGGSGTIYGLRYNAYLPRIGEFDQKLIAGIDRRAYDNACTLGEFGAAGCGPAAADVTVRPLSLTWVGQLLQPKFQAGASVGYSHNISGGSNGSGADFEAARAGAAPGYDLWRLNAQAGFVLPADWLLQGILNAQATHYALVPGEQYGLGGAASVRGFIERAVANDKGYTGSVELYTPDLASALQAPGSLRFLAFGDTGSVSRNQSLPGEETHTRLSSIGVGARYAFGKKFSIRVDAAHATHTDGHDSLKQQVHAAMLFYF
jgi:hemolysin activation/secretion protein